MKRVLSFVMAIVLVVGLVPAPAHAAIAVAAAGDVFALSAAEAFTSDEGFFDVASGVHLAPMGPERFDDAEISRSAGAMMGGFALDADGVAQPFDYGEITIGLAGGAEEGDIVELFSQGTGDGAWSAYGYYQVIDLSKRISDTETSAGATSSSAGTLGFTFEVSGAADFGTFAVVNKSAVELGSLTPVESMPGDTASAKFWNCLQTGGAYASAENATGSVTHHYADIPTKAGRTLEMHDIGIRREAGDDTGVITYIYPHERANDIYFENCRFEGAGFRFSVPGTYAFVNCTFTGCVGFGIETRSDDARVFTYGCTFEDNAPDKDVWNANAHDERHSNYAAIRLRGNRASLHAAGCTFKNLQTDSTVITRTDYDTKSAYDGMTFVFERNVMTDCGGAGVVIDNPVRGRIDANTFTNIGATRGMNGYKSTIHPTLGETGDKPGAGVGGNAVFARGNNTRTRVRGNIITNVMENGIEGTYYCISGNTIDTTGYRYDDATGDSFNGGYKTVSTEGIGGTGTWFITDNVCRNVHGRGICTTHWNNHPVVVEGNFVSRSANGSPEYDRSEGIKIRTDENSWKNVTVRDNELEGFLNNYRVINALNDTSGATVDNRRTRRCVDVSIDDANDGKLIGDVYDGVRGVKMTTSRDVQLPFVNGTVEGWRQSNLSSLSCEVDEGVVAADSASDSAGATSYLHVVPHDQYGRVWQRFELPDQTCLVCLELTVRASSPTVKTYVTSKDADGVAYPPGDGGSYSEYKIGLTGIDDETFTTTYVCLKARGTTDLGLWVADAEQTIDIANVRGWYAVDDPAAGKTPAASCAHEWRETSTVQPTCSEEGVRTFTCILCGETRTETIPRLIDLAAADVRTKVTLSSTRFTYDGSVKRPVVKKVEASGRTLVEGTDYTVSCDADCRDAGTYRVVVRGAGLYGGEVTAAFAIEPREVEPSVTLSRTSSAYTGKVVTPAICVRAGDVELAAKDYSVAWENNRNVGVATVVVKLRGNYAGSAAATFTINPKATGLAKVAARKRGFKATWRKQAGQVGGYQLQYALDKRFKRGARMVKVKGATVAAKAVSGLKEKTVYYVRVRTYKAVSGKMYHSTWSSVKRVTTKKR